MQGSVPVIYISFECDLCPGFSPSSNRPDPVAYSVQFGSTVGDESLLWQKAWWGQSHLVACSVPCIPCMPFFTLWGSGRSGGPPGLAGSTAPLNWWLQGNHDPGSFLSPGCSCPVDLSLCSRSLCADASVSPGCVHSHVCMPCAFLPVCVYVCVWRCMRIKGHTPCSLSACESSRKQQ